MYIGLPTPSKEKSSCSMEKERLDVKNNLLTSSIHVIDNARLKERESLRGESWGAKISQRRLTSA